ncbi:SMP-30/gluconolactonase/LRE family protein [Rhodococcus sp. NPDC059968]|uniref:SMP-30/gluconolactonase/LRE family protein n=1 Tax=Rhodococcus sp. NPDC059968 TaxID=3347017 RepID=UPI00366FA9F5
MHEVEWRTLASGFAMPEAPLWDHKSQSLLITDVQAGGVWHVTEDRKDLLVPHRRGIGGLAREANGGLIVSGKNLSVKSDAGNLVLATPAGGSPTARFNDLTVSEAGRIYVGSIDSEPGGRVNQPGELVMIDTDGAQTVVATGLQKTNGLGFSPDGKWLYHVDTGVGIVWRHEVHATGTLVDSRPLTQWNNGIPDGLAVASDGTVWVAVADLDDWSYICILSPSGEELRRIPTRERSVTSLCFGGPDLRTVFVTVGGAYDRNAQNGRVDTFYSDVAGLPRPFARIEVAPD